MPRSSIHIAVFTAIALAAPMIAGTADARDGRDGRRDHGGPTVEIVVGDHTLVGHRSHARHGRIRPRRIIRRMARRGGTDFEVLGYRRGKLRIEATNRRGMRKRYVFDARTGELLRVRPLYRVWSYYPRGHRQDYGFNAFGGRLTFQSW